MANDQKFGYPKGDIFHSDDEEMDQLRPVLFAESSLYSHLSIVAQVTIDRMDEDVKKKDQLDQFLIEGDEIQFQEHAAVCQAKKNKKSVKRSTRFSRYEIYQQSSQQKKQQIEEDKKDNKKVKKVKKVLQPDYHKNAPNFITKSCITFFLNTRNRAIIQKICTKQNISQKEMISKMRKWRTIQAIGLRDVHDMLWLSNKAGNVFRSFFRYFLRRKYMFSLLTGRVQRKEIYIEMKNLLLYLATMDGPLKKNTEQKEE